MRPVIFLAAVTSLVAAAPRDSDACSPAPCRPGTLTPVNDATVPANLPAFYWDPLTGAVTSPPDPSQIIFARAATPTTPLPLTATKLPDGAYLLAPKQPLTPGTDYVLKDQNTCGSLAGPSVAFRAASTAPLPTSLGTLTETMNRTGSITVESGGGACSGEAEAHQIEIALQPSADALAWKDVLHFETIVDGRLWSSASSAVTWVPPGSSWRGRGVDLLYLVCKSDDEYIADGLAAGPHEIVMRATLPGTTTVVQSSPLTIQLECADAGPSDMDDPDGAGGGCAASGPGSASWLLLLGPLAALLGRGRRSALRSA
jgi:hypothetical protein